MLRRPPRSTPLYSSAASDVYKRQAYSHMEVFRFHESSDICPKTVAMQPIHKEVDLLLSTSMSNYTRAKDEEKDESSGTLSATSLQCMLEYTTRPGDIVLTLHAQYGAIYDEAEKCGRLV